MYLPEEEWEVLDRLFDEILSINWNNARNDMKYISKLILSDIKK